MKVQVVIGGEVYEVEVEDTGDDSAQPAAMEGIQSVVPPRPGTGGLPGSSAKTYCSPVTGIVARVSVEVGQEVQAGEGLLVLEAMKMETNIVAAAAGKLKSVSVARGEAVKINQVLLEFE